VVKVDASASSDPDGDQLRYQWELNGEPLPGIQSAQGELTVTEPGVHRLVVRVSDAVGALASDEIQLRVGNSPPRVRITTPRHGSFFDWGDTIRYRVSAEDAEDGSTASGTIERGRVLLSHRVATRRFSETDDRDPGLQLMRRTTCFSCHTTKAASAGPPYHEVARRYDQAPEALDKLAAKVISGGTGVWGNKPMPPHPQHTLEETRQMVRWILALRDDGSVAPAPGTHGFFRAEKGDLNDPSALVLTAEYVDNGAASEPASTSPTIPSIRGEDVCVLHSRRKRAAFSDRSRGVELVDVFEGAVGLVSRLGPGDWFAFQDLLLEDIDRVTIQLAAPEGFRGSLSLRTGSPEGPELARVNVTGKSGPLGPVFDQRVVTLSTSLATGLCDLYVVHVGQEVSDQVDAVDEGEVDEEVDEGEGEVDEGEAEARQANVPLSIAWMEFHESEAARRRKAKEEESVKRILLVPTKLDHAWATHMYTDVCRLLAETLNQTPGVEAVVSPDLDWPTDPELLDRIDALVYYSRPAGDILLSPQHRAATEALLSRGVGLTAIHWSTGAGVDVGPQYERVLGGWFNFDFSGLAVDRKRLQQVEPNHPICRGWREYDLRDEFYLNLKFHPEAIPVLKVNIDGQDQTVAWTLRREDGGRSFGTTLGHFHDNFSLPSFRRMLAGGILWTAGVDIPEAGVPVEIDPDWLTLEDPNQPQERQWTYTQLRGVLARSCRPGAAKRSFARGEALFTKASCVSCHDIGTTHDFETKKLGPNLTTIRQRMAVHPDPSGYLLREIVEPSHRIDDAFRSQILLLDDGQIVHGMVRADENEGLLIATDPTKPDQFLRIREDQVESRRASETSMMPVGLLNSLDESEILDLLTYVESGGNPTDVAFAGVAMPIEPWADSKLPVTEDLRLWLDASRINSARRSVGLLETHDGQALDAWPDASGHRLLAGQRQAESQPVLRTGPNGSFVEFDGIDDYLLASETGLRTNQFTASVVFRPDHNRGWPGILSANAVGRNDYQSGFNIDLMHQPTDRFETVMTEGTGYPGVLDLMTESHEFGQFFILTVRSQAGGDGVVLRINGREQLTRERPESVIDCQELTVGARYWSNEVGVPPHNRGFLAGAIAQVLIYDRALSDEELVANEVFLWESNRSLLDPERR
jgi:putative heme-binding domain-containing protein